jgi:hypothetical protein
MAANGKRSPRAGRLEDLQLSWMALTNFLIEAYFKTSARQTDAALKMPVPMDARR